MLWQHYVFRRGTELHDMWDRTFDNRTLRLLYITGRGFDMRACASIGALVDSVRQSGATVEKAELMLVGFSGYHLSDELIAQTEENATTLEHAFSPLGPATSVVIGASENGEDDIGANNSLRRGADVVASRIDGYTDVILDVSSLPRVAYLAFMTRILQRLVPEKTTAALVANHVNFQVVVAEDPVLDAKIRSEDLSNDLVLVPGFSGTLLAESFQGWPLVWFPMLGENRIAQFSKVMDAVIPAFAEICPVLPHPSRDPRRADRLLVEYMTPLFQSRETPTSNVLYVHESHPFEAYRQLLLAMRRYLKSMTILEGCRLVVTPLASKLITLGAGLACFEIRPSTMNEKFGVAIPYAEPTRYVVDVEALKASKPELSAMVLTGDAYDVGGRPTSG